MEGYIYVLCPLYFVCSYACLGSYNKGGGLYICPLSFVLCMLICMFWVAITKVEGYICVLCPLSFVQFSPYLHIYILFMCVSSSFIHNVLLWLFDVYKFRLLQYSVLRIVYCV